MQTMPLQSAGAVPMPYPVLAGTTPKLLTPPKLPEAPASSTCGTAVGVDATIKPEQIVRREEEAACHVCDQKFCL